jgi:hypothetical protein
LVAEAVGLRAGVDAGEAEQMSARIGAQAQCPAERVDDLR